MTNLTVKEVMQLAAREGFLVPAFNVAYIPMVEPICNTLKECETLGLVEVARPDVEKFGAESFARVAEEYKKHADRNYAFLHLDHVPVIDEDGLPVDWRKLIQEGLDLGFDSVMIDGSRLPLKENIAVTREVVEMAHARGVVVEAELGAVLGHEKGPLPPYDELFESGKGFTRVDEAERFVKETKVDWLSVAIGNIHGAISGAAKNQKKVEARLNIDHLRKLKKATGVPLVLHGGSGIKVEYVREAIRNGIAKINIGTDIRQAYERALGESGGDNSAAQEAVAEKIRELIKETYRIEGTARRI